MLPQPHRLLTVNEMRHDEKEAETRRLPQLRAPFSYCIILISH